MLIYLVLATMPFALALVFRNFEKPKVKIAYLVVCGIFLFLFMALRSSSVGSTDTYNYMKMMKEAVRANSWKQLYDPDGVEKGFQMFLYILSRLFTDEQWIVVISSAIYTILTLWFIYKNSDDVALSITIYITLGLMMFHMQGMRQSIAMCICLIAYEFAKKRKLILFLLVIALATCFHQTAIIFIPIYIVPKIRFTATNLILVISGTVVMFFLSSMIIDFANDMFDREYTTNVDSGGLVATLVYVLILAFALIFNKKLKENNQAQDNASIFFITIIGFAFYVMRYFAAQQVERISFYFMYGQMILLPNSLQQLSRKEAIVVKAVAYIAIILLFVYRLNGSDFVPFEFYWQS